jgi:tetratricopeptide (TPR) repeat protein
MSVWASAPPPHRPEPSGEVDLGHELEALKKRADDHGTALKKHQAAVTQLSEAVTALVALGKKRNRWINVNSFVAYILFTLLLGGALIFLYRARMGELEAERALAIAERDAARAETAAAPHDDVIAMALYATVKSGDDVALVAREAELATAQITAAERAMFTDAIGAAKARLSGSVERDGVAAFKAGKWAEASAVFERALADNPASPRAAQLRYYAGVAKWKQADHAAAAAHLEHALAGKLDAASVDARYYYAAALDKLGQLDRARGEFDAFAAAYPQSPLAGYARRRSAQLARVRARAADPDGEPGEPRARVPAAAPAPTPAAPAAPAPAEEPPATAPAPSPEATTSPPAP